MFSPVVLQGERGLQFTGNQPWSVRGDTLLQTGVQMFGETPGDRVSQTESASAHEDFFSLIPFLWKFLLFVSKSAFWGQGSSSFLLGVVH